MPAEESMKQKVFVSVAVVAVVVISLLMLFLSIWLEQKSLHLMSL
jgi:lipopolysaccharide/colanic/teichoic acid biosynthesis glycosyltransferase